MDEKALPKRKKITITSTGSIMIAYVVLFIYFSLASENFLSSQNVLSLLRSTVTTSLLAFGTTYCLIINKIDLTIGSTFAFSGVLVSILVSRMGMNFYMALGVALLAVIVIGFVNGFIVAYTTIPPFIVTLAMQSVVRGLANVISDSMPINFNNEDFVNFSNYRVFGFLANQVIIMLIIGVVLAILLKCTVFGRHMYAIGGNYDTARYSGVNVRRVIIIVYIICSITALFSGVLSTGRVRQGQPGAGLGYEGDAIAAAVLGGTSFSGGKGSILGTMFGALVLSTFTNGLYMLGVNYYIQLIITGLLTLLVVYFDMMKNDASGRIISSLFKKLFKKS